MKAIDAAGNTDLTTASRTWTVDSTPPETGIGSGPSGAVNSTSANFAFSSEGSNFACSLDGAAYSECHSPRSYFDLGNGTHALRVKATDIAGKDTPAERTWTVDTEAPKGTVEINKGTVEINKGAASTRKLSAVLNLAARDVALASGVAHMRFSQDGRRWTPWQDYAGTKKWTLKKGKAGIRTVFAQYRDEAGNESTVAKDAIRYRP